MQRPYFVKIVFDFLDHARRPVLAEIVHAVEGLENAAPLLGFGLDFAPEVFHDHCVVLPVVGVVCQHLQLAIRNIPVLVRGRLLEDGFELRAFEKTFVLPAKKSHQSQGRVSQS